MSNAYIPPGLERTLADVVQQARKDQRIRRFDPDERPAAPTNVTVTIQVREKKTTLEFQAKVSCDPLTPNTCQADISMYVFQLRYTDSGGTPKDGTDRLEKSIKAKEVFDSAEPNPHVVFHDLKRPKSYYVQVRGRIKDKDHRASDWTAWTTPVLPTQESLPKPPAPTFVSLTYASSGRTRFAKNRGILQFTPVRNWSVPGGDNEDDMARYAWKVEVQDNATGPWNKFASGTVEDKDDGEANEDIIRTFRGARPRNRYRAYLRSIDHWNRRGDWGGPYPSAAGNGPSPNVQSVTNVVVSADGPRRIVATWDDPNEPEDIHEYRVVWRKGTTDIVTKYVRHRRSVLRVADSDRALTNFNALVFARDEDGNEPGQAASGNATESGTWHGSIITDGTLDTGALGSDGSAPASSPVPTLKGGIGALFASWAAVANADPVTYEVHLGTTSGFTPDANSLCATVGGTLFTIRTLPAGGALVYGQNYYVKTIAKDVDGSATASAASNAAQLVEVNSADIAANAVTAVEIAANAVTAAKLETDLILTTRIIAGTSGAARVELGIDDAGKVGIYAYDSANEDTFQLDGQSGALWSKGTYVFGGGALLPDSTIDFLNQASSGYMTAAVVQKKGKTVYNVSSTNITWGATTRAGNHLFMQVCIYGSGTITINTPTGWTQIGSSQPIPNNSGRMSIFKIENCGARNTETVSLSAAADSMIITMLEYSGIATSSAEDKTATDSGTGTSLNTGTTATTAQADELWIAFFAITALASLSGYTNGFQYVEQQFSSDITGVITSKNVTATGTANTGATSSQSDNWVGKIVTFKAKAAAPTVETPASTKASIFAKNLSGSKIAYKGDDGVERILGLVGFGFRAYRNATNSHTSTGNFQQIGYNATEYNDETCFSTSTMRFTVPTGMAGRWHLEARAEFEANGTGRRELILVKDPTGTPVNLDNDLKAGGAATATSLFVSCDVELAAGDVIEVQAYQNSGGNLLYQGTTSSTRRFAGSYLGPGS